MLSSRETMESVMEYEKQLEQFAEALIVDLSKKKTLSGGERDIAKMKMIILDYLEDAYDLGHVTGWQLSWDVATMNEDMPGCKENENE